VLDESGEHRHSKYVELWERIHELHAVGADLADIARRLSISRRTVYRYLARPEPPPRRRITKRRRKLVEPYKEYLTRRWDEGCHNKSRLFREVWDRGYGYSQSNVIRFLAQLERGDRDAGSCTYGLPAPGIRPPSAYRVAIWFVSRSEQLSEKQSKYLDEVCQQAEEIRKARDLTGEFCSMLRALKGERLDEWMAKVESSGVVELQRFALSLKKDLGAVRAGLTLEFSQGQTEGHVNKLKLLKRQSYGRAGFVLLRKRVLEAA
jgi:transposase